jgi:hypothetical protein
MHWKHGIHGARVLNYWGLNPEKFFQLYRRNHSCHAAVFLFLAESCWFRFLLHRFCDAKPNIVGGLGKRCFSVMVYKQSPYNNVLRALPCLVLVFARCIVSFTMANLYLTLNMGVSCENDPPELVSSYCNLTEHRMSKLLHRINHQRRKSFICVYRDCCI